MAFDGNGDYVTTASHPDLNFTDGTWTTGPIAPGAQVTLTFDKPGTVVFLCKEHPWSQGQMTVQ